MPDQLNELERRVLDYVVEYLRTNTYQPSIREIGREFSIKSTKTVSELLQALAQKGWIERDPSRSRGVRLIGMEMRAQPVSVPMYESPESPAPSGQLQLDRRIVGSYGVFIMPMAGDHLVEEGIRAGDLLVVEPVDAAALEHGDVVIAHTGGSTAVRRFSVSGTERQLDPVRRGELPLALTMRQAASVIRGRVTAVVRRLRAPQQPETTTTVATPAV